MSFQETLRLDLGRECYEILVGNGLIASAGELILPYLKEPHTVVITDENVAPSYLSGLRNSLIASNIRSEEIILPSGEQTKDFNFLKDLVSQLLDLKIERDTTLLALGGGVLCFVFRRNYSRRISGFSFLFLRFLFLGQLFLFMK